jgi:hypothetical protein
LWNTVSKNKKTNNILGENICQRSISKGMLSKICNELLKLNNKHTNNIIKKWIKDLNSHFIIKDTHSHFKRCSTSHVLREIQIKARIYTTHWLKWPKSWTLTTLNAGELIKQQKLSFIASGNAKWYHHFGRWLLFVIKLNLPLP